jgi:hypothetical protein
MVLFAWFVEISHGAYCREDGDEKENHASGEANDPIKLHLQ